MFQELKEANFVEGKLKELEGVTEQDFGELIWLERSTGSDDGRGDLGIELIGGSLLLGDCKGVKF